MKLWNLKTSRTEIVGKNDHGGKVRETSHNFSTSCASKEQEKLRVSAITN